MLVSNSPVLLSTFFSPPAPPPPALASLVLLACCVPPPAGRVPPQTHSSRWPPPKSAKRALRILAEASGKSVSAAEHALRAAGHNMGVARVMPKLGVEVGEGGRRLKEAQGNLRRALKE